MSKKSREKFKYLENEKSFYDEIKSTFQCHKINFKRDKSYMESSDWIRVQQQEI